MHHIQPENKNDCTYFFRLKIVLVSLNCLVSVWSFGEIMKGRKKKRCENVKSTCTLVNDDFILRFSFSLTTETQISFHSFFSFVTLVIIIKIFFMFVVMLFVGFWLFVQFFKNFFFIFFFIACSLACLLSSFLACIFLIYISYFLD